MRRWRRLVGRPAAVLSLLLCAATAILWVRSYRTMDELFLIYRGDGSEGLSSLQGQIRFKHTLPRTGTRDGVARISHRTNRVVALPPRPWAEERLKSRWLIFGYDNAYLDPKTGRQALLAIAAYRDFVLQIPRRPLSSPNPDPQVARQLQTLRQLETAAVQADLLLSSRPSESYWAVTFPMWLLMVPAALLVPIAWLISTLRRAVRSRAGRCRSCGYDLTGNASGVCPECGAKVVNPIATAPTA